MSITWHSFDLKSGARGQQLTTDKQGTTSRIIGEATDLSGLGVATKLRGEPVPGWDAATLGGRMMLVALDEDEHPVWGGMILRRRGGLTSPWVSIDLVTLEAYFDRRYVQNHTWTQTAQSVIVSGIITGDAVPTGVQFTVDAPASSILRDRTYLANEDKTVLSVLQELMEVEDGPEFTVDLEWANADRTILNRVVRVRDRIGTAANQIARFEMPGSVIDGEYIEDFSTDNGANDVMAYSSGEGDVRPESDHQVAQALLNNGWVRYERRFQPSTSITDKATLDAHARADLADKQDGVKQLTLEANLATAPRVDVDFHLGDNVTAVLTCDRFPEQTGPDGDRIPGYTKSVRCTGWEIDYDAGRIRPTLLDVG